MKRIFRVVAIVVCLGAVTATGTGCWFLAGAGAAAGTIYVASQFQKCPYCGDLTTADRRVCPNCHRDMITGEIPTPDKDLEPVKVAAGEPDPELDLR